MYGIDDKTISSVRPAKLSVEYGGFLIWLRFKWIFKVMGFQPGYTIP